MTERIKELQEKLKNYRESYYNLEPIVSDSVYDSLKDELQKLDPKNIEVTIIGADVPKVSVWEKIEHKIPMGSLNKVNSETEFRSWAEKMIRNGAKDEFVMTHKFDGSSLELVFTNSSLESGITRGNGIVGEDITTNIIQIKSIPNNLSKQTIGTIYARGEVIMHKDIFQLHYSSEYANPRNTAAGKVREKKNGGEDCKNLEFYAFDLEMKCKPDTEEMKFKALEVLGFKTPWYFIGNTEEIINEFKNQTLKRDSLNYEIDGLVISVRESSICDSFGSHNMKPIAKIAWKFESEAKITRIKDVKWGVGPTGRITPVAVVEPVKIGGVTITNISLHNIKMFRNLDLHHNDEVLIERANEVIPYIVENVTRGTSP